MIEISYFASVREKLQIDSEQMELPTEIADISALIAFLVEQRDPLWGEVLNDSKMMVAVNKVVVDRKSVIHKGDEIAFFPPMTGG